MEYTRLADAAYRHLSQFMDGEDIDQESGNNHLFHALASIAMLVDMTENNPDMDDRHKPKKLEPSPLSEEDLKELEQLSIGDKIDAITYALENKKISKNEALSRLGFPVNLCKCGKCE